MAETGYFPAQRKQLWHKSIFKPGTLRRHPWAIGQSRCPNSPRGGRAGPELLDLLLVNPGNRDFAHPGGCTESVGARRGPEITFVGVVRVRCASGSLLRTSTRYAHFREYDRMLCTSKQKNWSKKQSPYIDFWNRKNAVFQCVSNENPYLPS